MNVRTAVETEAMTGEQHIELVESFAAHNYHPLPVVVAKAEGVWVEDADGKRYMDMLAAYSAVNFGHCHPELIAVAKQQLDRVTLTSRAFHNDQLGPLCKELAELYKGPGLFNKAKDIIVQLVQLQPSCWELVRELARLRAETGEKKVGIAELEHFDEARLAEA